MDLKSELHSSIPGVGMNVICRCAFGLDLDAYHSKNPVVEKIKKASDDILSTFTIKSWVESFFMQFFVFYFPGIMKYMSMWPKGYTDLWKVSDGIMKVHIAF